MGIDWDYYLSCYQKSKGGLYFGGADQLDSQLVLTEGERRPILICLDEEVSSGRACVNSLKAKTVVTLGYPYHLHIRPESVAARGWSGIKEVVKYGNDYGYPDVTRKRIITTDNAQFTKQVLGSLTLRQALQSREREYLRVTPMPQEEQNHLVEVGIYGLEGTIHGSPWVTASMTQEVTLYRGQDRERIQQEANQHFAEQMEGFLTLLRAARDAVLTWRI